MKISDCDKKLEDLQSVALELNDIEFKLHQIESKTNEFFSIIDRNLIELGKKMNLIFEVNFNLEKIIEEMKSQDYKVDQSLEIKKSNNLNEAKNSKDVLENESYYLSIDKYDLKKLKRIGDFDFKGNEKYLKKLYLIQESLSFVDFNILKIFKSMVRLRDKYSYIKEEIKLLKKDMLKIIKLINENFSDIANQIYN